jgi:4-aminobutyrate aminotransferase-like enzyme
LNATQKILHQLRQYESRNITYLEPDGSWPIVWERARGVHVWDADGKKYLDLTAAFGVAAAGHANPRVVRAGQRQMEKLLHAMGDVHPHALKAELARELSRITFERWSKNKPAGKKRIKLKPITGKTIFCNSGFEAVEAALKTALLATGKPGVIAFKGAYHGLGYGALNATHREHFRGPFVSQIGGFVKFLDYPKYAPEMKRFESEMDALLRSGKFGAALVEPIQLRGGIVLPHQNFLPKLRQLCDLHGVMQIVDEIFTGFGRTGALFACEHSGTVPDLICLGKALTGGFPLSACVGRADLMDAAWPASTGEAIHTSTFLGHPVGCAMALAQIAEIRQGKLAERSAKLGEWLLRKLAKAAADSRFEVSVRGSGLMAGMEFFAPDGEPATLEVLRMVKKMLRRGFILLPEGAHGNVISFTPPLTIKRAQLNVMLKALKNILGLCT